MDDTDSSHANTISLVLADDNRLLREGIASLIRGQPDLRVVAVVGDAREVVRAVRRAKPGLVLLDFGLESGNSVLLTTTIRRDVPQVKVVVMGLLPLRQDVADLVKAGVSGFLMKDASFEVFVSTIRAVAAGAQVLPPELTGSLFDQIVSDAGTQNPALLLEGMRLTRRERQVIGLISQGLTNKQIGSRLLIATPTVKSHVHNVLEKLALRSRFELVRSRRRNDDT